MHKKCLLSVNYTVLSISDCGVISQMVTRIGNKKDLATFNDKCVLIDFLIRFSITGYKVILQIGK